MVCLYGCPLIEIDATDYSVTCNWNANGFLDDCANGGSYKYAGSNNADAHEGNSQDQTHIVSDERCWWVW